MFGFEELFSKRNVRDAFRHMESKPNRLGSDGILLSDLPEFWRLNHQAIQQQVLTGRYRPSVVMQTEMVKKTGGRRLISSFSSLDCFLLRLLAQKLQRYLHPLFLERSYAYQENKGVLPAVEQARDWMNAGLSYLVEIDLQHYFDEINLERLSGQLATLIEDQAVLQLIQAYLYCRVSYQYQEKTKTVGLIQGSAMSPVLSNFYLHELDSYLEERGLSWMRFADNIYIFCKRRVEAQALFDEVTGKLSLDYGLPINQKKSGVFKALNRRILGYDFSLREGLVECRKHQYTSVTAYQRWHPSKLRQVNRQYYIVEDGILNKKDFSLLFENEEHKHHLPIEAIEQINVYSDIVITSSCLALLAQKGLPLVLHNHLGDIQSYFIPERMKSSAAVVLAQCQLYQSAEKRLAVAKKFDLAHLHNLRANCRYYLKKAGQKGTLRQIEAELTEAMSAIKLAKSVDELMLIEARGKQAYYRLFNQVLNQPAFAFVKRTKRPPRDALNALISFGNTVLYSQVLRMVWLARLDPRIAVLHASRNRPYSLQLDFADYMKPVIVDRVILSLVNKHQLDAQEHFDYREDGSVYLNADGKRIFLHALEEKFQTRLVIKHTSYTYLQLIRRDIQAFKKLVLGQEALSAFRPYKYY